jgi:predicted nucleic-acid-binding protein
MIGLDTNVVLRLMVQDDPAQLRRARRAVAAQCSEEEPGLINRIVLVEVIWVLSRGYKYSR